MSNSKYEYVKSFEVEDEVVPPNIIVVRLDGRDFRRFSGVHEFEKPNDINALKLMNECAKSLLEQFPDIALGYGYSDEFSFVFKTATKFYQRRASKILSLIVSFFASVYVTKWKEFFPTKYLRYAPSFRSRVICCASLEVLQSYFSWRQNDCHLNNLYNTCFWQLIKNGKSEMEAEEMLKGSQKHDLNELLYQSFNINYKMDIPDIFRQGTCVLKIEVEDIVKYKDDGCPVKRPRKMIIEAHSENIAASRFLNGQLRLLKELGQFTEYSSITKPEYIKSFQYEGRLLPCTWVVIRIDGCHFHRFSDIHEFEKPNDAQALNLMNSCATEILEEFKDIVFAYGVSDEYSFVLKKNSELYGRRASEIVSAVVSLFSSMYTKKWKDFFPLKEMRCTPHFDGRAVCYPSLKILKDYLAWRQVDCHINNQYNTCFWMLVKSGKSKREAQNHLKGTQAQEKNELLNSLSGITDYYNTLPQMFCRGSSVFWDKHETGTAETKEENTSGKPGKMIVVRHCNIIEKRFWKTHPEIFERSDVSCMKHIT